jgi:hypothetical protein
MAAFLTPLTIGLNDSNATINVSVVSSNSQLSYWGLNVSMDGALVASNYSTNASGGFVTSFVQFNSTNSSDAVLATYYWGKMDGSTFSNTIVYVKGSGSTQYSLTSFLGYLKNSGMPNFGLALFALFCVVVVSVFVSKFNGMLGIFSAMLLAVLFAFSGFFDLPGVVNAGWYFVGFMLAFGTGLIILSLRS